MRIAAPVTIYQQENVLVSECAVMKLTRMFRDPVIRLRHRANHSAETNYSTTTLVGELTYSEGHSRCKRTFENVGRNHMSSLYVTEDLEIIPKTVTVRERLDKGDMRVLENGAYILATLR